MHIYVYTKQKSACWRASLIIKILIMTIIIAMIILFVYHYVYYD